MAGFAIEGRRRNLRRKKHARLANDLYRFSRIAYGGSLVPTVAIKLPITCLTPLPLQAPRMAQRLIVLSLDGLTTSAISSYGSSWNDTPTLDRLASQGTVFDRWIATHDDPANMLQSWLASESGDVADCFAPWCDRGAAELLTDCAQTFSQFRERFDQATLVESDLTSTEVDHLVAGEDIEATRYAQLIGAAIERNLDDDPWSVLWIHSGFLRSCWDAPRDLYTIDELEEIDEPSDDVELIELDNPAEQAAPEYVPPIFDSVRPPVVQLDPKSHPDLLTAWMRTYGCQVCLVDTLIAFLIQCVRDKDVNFVVTGTSGFSLGQNGWIGADAGPVRSSHTRLPLVISGTPPVRVSRLTSAATLPQIVESLATTTQIISAQHWSQDDDPKTQIRTESSRSANVVTTSNWLFVEENDGQPHLFLKPDDIDDANDVASLRQEVVDELQTDARETPS